jgi:hypothetical protein
MSNSIPETSLAADVFRYVRYQLRGRRGLVAAGLSVGAAALWFGWPLLVVAGLAPILLALAPCAIMCAVGVCTMKACSTGSATDAARAPIQPATDETIVSVTASELAATAEPLSSAAPPPGGRSLVEDQGAPRAGGLGLSGELTDQPKEKTP